tara:strand:- start:177 stop:506 length:330 start_codon:yes stop_codon:yes gene_type:complete
MNKLLIQFLKGIESEDTGLFDITTILSEQNVEVFENYQNAMAILFKGPNFAEGIQKINDSIELTEIEQVSLLFILKVIENLIGNMEEGISELTDTLLPPDGNESGPMYG